MVREDFLDRGLSENGDLSLPSREKIGRIDGQGMRSGVPRDRESNAKRAFPAHPVFPKQRFKFLFVFH